MYTHTLIHIHMAAGQTSLKDRTFELSTSSCSPGAKATRSPSQRLSLVGY